MHTACHESFQSLCDQKKTQNGLKSMVSATVSTVATSWIFVPFSQLFWNSWQNYFIVIFKGGTFFSRESSDSVFNVQLLHDIMENIQHLGSYWSDCDLDCGSLIKLRGPYYYHS